VLLVLLITGSVLIIGEPRRALLNSTFYIKMALLAVAIVITAGLQWSLSASSNFWELNAVRRAAGRIAAVTSMLVWGGIIFAGRWIAYTSTG
jgi:membrane glycosyltransferase